MSDIPKPLDDYASEFVESFKLEKEKTALIVVDMQYASGCRNSGLGKLMKEKNKENTVAYRFDRIENVVIPNIKKILKYCRGKKIKVIYITGGSDMHDYSDVMPRRKLLYKATNNTRGTKEHEILDELKPLKTECIINKKTTSAFNSTNIDLVLRSMGIEYLLFTGISTNMCVDMTAKDAAERGYKCLLIEECLGAAKREYHEQTLVAFQRSFGRVDSINNVIEELQG